MSMNWTHLPADDIDNFIRYAKANGFVNRNNAIQIDFDDLCALFRKLREQSEKIRQLTGSNPN